MATNMRIIETKESNEHGNVFGVISFLTEILINRMHTIQECLNIFKSVVERKWKNTDGRAYTVTTADPFPEAKHVFIGDSKIFSGFKIGRDSAEML